MNELQIFQKDNFKVRVVERDGEPWFVAIDACDALELDNNRQAVSRLDEDEKANVSLNDGSQNRYFTIVSESGLYSLVLGSRKPEAKQFKRWITHEVIPAIRKTGSYSIKTREQVILEGYQTLLGLVEEMKPKAEYFDALVDRNLLTSFRDTAKELKVKESLLIDWLLGRAYVYRDTKGRIKPYSQFVDKLFEVKEYRNPKNDHVGTQTLITPKGRETFRLLIQN